MSLLDASSPRSAGVGSLRLLLACLGGPLIVGGGNFLHESYVFIFNLCCVLFLRVLCVDFQSVLREVFDLLSVRFLVSRDVHHARMFEQNCLMRKTLRILWNQHRPERNGCEFGPKRTGMKEVERRWFWYVPRQIIAHPSAIQDRKAGNCFQD